MNQSMNDEAVYRTAPATPGLLISNKLFQRWNQKVVLILGTLYMQMIV